MTEGEGGTRSCRIAIIDDHPSVVLGVTAILNSDEQLVVAGSGATVPEVLEGSDDYDLALLDLVLGDGSRPQDNLQTLTDRGIPVLVYTSGDQPHLIREAGRAGAVGMIRKSELPNQLVAGVHAALRGDVVASSDWAAALDADEEFVSARLSVREAQVLALYASGETAERVAAQLYISRETVLDHIRRIRTRYAAIGRPAHNKLDLYHRAVEDGLL